MIDRMFYGSILAIFLTGMIAVLVIGCNQAEFAESISYGDFHISCFSGGKLVREFTSSGNVMSEPTSDGWKFRDKKTHSLIKISGGLIIIEPK